MTMCFIGELLLSARTASGGNQDSRTAITKMPKHFQTNLAWGFIFIKAPGRASDCYLEISGRLDHAPPREITRSVRNPAQSPMKIPIMRTSLVVCLLPELYIIMIT